MLSSQLAQSLKQMSCSAAGKAYEQLFAKQSQFHGLYASDSNEAEMSVKISK